MPGLADMAQSDFSAGMCPGIAPHLIPPNGAARMVNLLIDEDGSPYKRGGTQALSDPFGETGLTFLWDGWLAGGQRTVVANKDDFGVLDTDDETVINLGGSGLTGAARGVAVAGILFIDGGTLYAGSRKAASYTTGTVAATNGSTTLTGTGTSWLANVDAGMILTVGSGTYVVESVSTDASLTLTKAFNGSTATGLSYTLSALVTAPGSVRHGPYAAVGQRLVSFEGARVYFSAYGDPLTWNADEDYHEFTGGVQNLGGESINNTLMCFTTRGVYTIADMELEIVDDFGNVQQPESQASKDLVLWGVTGVAGWRDTLVVPAADGVWLIGSNQFTLISDSMSSLYRGYVRDGCRPGQAAVIESTYMLPIIDPGGTVVDLLACRLDRRTRYRQQDLWPWTVQRGAGASVSGLAVRVGTTDREPVLLGAELNTADTSGHDAVAAVNEVQTITVTATGGTWSLGPFRGDFYFAALAYNISASALMATSGWDPDIVVSGGPAASAPLVLTFTADYGGLDQALLTADGTNLTGTGAVVTIVETTKGAPAVEASPYPSRVLQLGAFEHDGQALDQNGDPVEPDLVLRDIATGRLNENTVKKLEVRYQLIAGDGGDPVMTAYYGTDARPSATVEWDDATWDLDYWPAGDDLSAGFVEMFGDVPETYGDAVYRWRVNKRLRYIRPRLTVTGGASRMVIQHVRVLVRPSGRI